jgi:putative ABC transport system permease protein
MNVGQLFLEALESPNSNKLRSGLTILGIVIGVAAVVAMLGVGQGASNSYTNQINSLGTNLLFVMRNYTLSDGAFLPRIKSRGASRLL